MSQAANRCFEIWKPGWLLASDLLGLGLPSFGNPASRYPLRLYDNRDLSEPADSLPIDFELCVAT